MKKKSNNKKDFNNLPFSNGIRAAKYEFIKMIDAMPDDEFILFTLTIMDLMYNEDLDEDLDDDFDDDCFDIE